MKHATDLSLPHDEIKQRMALYKQAHPRSRTIDIAKALGVSEVELLFATHDDEAVVSLRPDWLKIWNRIPEMGRVMALTRNSHVVSECRGVYGEAKIPGGTGIVHSDEIDLRLFTGSWRAIFAVQVESARGSLHSLQIFDRCGRAVHKIYLEGESSEEAYARLVQDFRCSLSEQIYAIEREEGAILAPVDGTTMASFLEDWQNLDDTHAFHGLLRRHGLDRLQAMEAARGRWTREVGPESVSHLLEAARSQKVALMVFVGNSGMIQIYSGTVRNLLRTGNWFNVIDPNFNLHIDMDGIGHVYIVEKPTRSGSVWSLEVYNRERQMILSFFGLRKDDAAPAAEWKRLLTTLEG